MATTNSSGESLQPFWQLLQLLRTHQVENLQSLWQQLQQHNVAPDPYLASTITEQMATIKIVPVYLNKVMTLLCPLLIQCLNLLWVWKGKTDNDLSLAFADGSSTGSSDAESCNKEKVVISRVNSPEAPERQQTNPCTADYVDKSKCLQLIGLFKLLTLPYRQGKFFIADGLLDNRPRNLSTSICMAFSSSRNTNCTFLVPWV
jgi:hypothetical protein